MKLAVIGSRDFTDRELMHSVLNKCKQSVKVLVSGGAKGADRLAEEWALSLGIKTEIYIPDWNLYGNSAGFIRNKLIINSADATIAFWDGTSKGTKSSIDYAKKLNKPVKIIYYNSILLDGNVV